MANIEKTSDWLKRHTQKAIERAFSPNFEKNSSNSAHILSALALLALAYGLYIYLRYKVSSMDLVLGAYLGFLNAMCFHAAFLSFKVAIFYLAFRWAAQNWQIVNRCFPLVVLAVIIILIMVFFNNLFPPLSDVKLLSLNAFNNVWNCIDNWLTAFINIMALGIVFAYWFLSPEIGKMVSVGIMTLLNLVIFLSIGLAFSVIPVIGQTSGVLQVCLNFIVMSDVFILFGVTSLFKWLADYIFRKYLNTGQGQLGEVHHG